MEWWCLLDMMLGREDTIQTKNLNVFQSYNATKILQEFYRKILNRWRFLIRIMQLQLQMTGQ